MTDNYYYLVSDNFDYSKLICRDAGPHWSSSFGIKSLKISRALKLKLKPKIGFIVDNRITENEFNKVQGLNSALTIYKLVDEQYASLKSKYMQNLLTLRPDPARHFICPYSGSELFELLRKIHSPKNVHILPYPYQKCCIYSNTSIRLRRLAISGALNPSVYPERWRIYIQSHKNFFTRRKIAVLPHPGYPDIGIVGSGQTTHSSYIEWLSHYLFFLVTPSINDYELLKYAECAAARCILVGTLSSSLPSSLPHICTKNMTTKEVFTIINNLSLEQATEMAIEYQKWFQKYRDPEFLLAKLSSSLAKFL